MEIIDTRIADWLIDARALLNSSNLICYTKPEFKSRDCHPLISFGSSLAQFLAVTGESEVCPIFGRHINTKNDFAYQLGRNIPWEFELGASLDAMFDIMLYNGPHASNRYFIWHDAQHLFNSDRKLFEAILECAIVACYMTSNHRTRRLNQKLVLLFDDMKEEDLHELETRNYYTPVANDLSKKVEDHYMLHRQQMVLVK